MTTIKAERNPDHNRDNQNPQTSVAGFEDWSLCMGSLENRYLISQGDVFSLQCSLATKAAEKGTERY
jgi:hypothetical protein